MMNGFMGPVYRRVLLKLGGEMFGQGRRAPDR